jgi:hypothetical protein
VGDPEVTRALIAGVGAFLVIFFGVVLAAFVAGWVAEILAVLVLVPALIIGAIALGKHSATSPERQAQPSSVTSTPPSYYAHTNLA